MPILLENPASVSIETINQIETSNIDLSVDQVG